MFGVENDLVEKLLTVADAERRLELAKAGDEERSRIRSRLVALVNSFLQKIPREEYDYLMLYFLEDVPQRSIGNLFQVTQRAISYRLQRAIKRLQFLVQVADICEQQLSDDLTTLFRCEETTSIVCKVFRVTNLSEVQRQEGSTFFRVRSRFSDAISRLERLDINQIWKSNPELAERIPRYIECLKLVRSNFGILNSSQKRRHNFCVNFVG